MFSGIVSVIPWKDHFIQFILQIVVLIFHAENLIKKNKKAFVFSPEATRGRIELNMTKCTFLQSTAGQYEQTFISLYFWLICGIRYISLYFVTNK